jgi:prolyl-tRNA synthetase
MAKIIEKGTLFDLNMLKSERIPYNLRIFRGGKYVSQIESGIYAFEPLGAFVVKKLEDLLRKIFSSVGAEEMIFPIVQGISLWKKTGRHETFRSNMEFVDADLILSPSSEELMLSIVSRNKESGNLPMFRYCLGPRFRKEVRPKNGLVRTREFHLFEGLALSANEDQHADAFAKVTHCLKVLCDKLGLDAFSVKFKTRHEAEYSIEFVAKTSAIGEARILHCQSCGDYYRAAQFNKCECGEGGTIENGIEFADIIRCGTYYAESMHVFAKTLDDNSHRNPFSLYVGIGITRLMAVIVEVFFEKYKKFVWPEAISPFKCSFLMPQGNYSFLTGPPSEAFLEQSDFLFDIRDIPMSRMIKEHEALGIPQLLLVNKEKKRYIYYDRTNDKEVISQDLQILIKKIRR